MSDESTAPTSAGGFLVLPPSGPDLREHFAYLRHRGDVLKCCGIVDNLRIFEHSNRTLRAVCIKCLRRHRLMFAETGLIGARKT